MGCGANACAGLDDSWWIDRWAFEPNRWAVCSREAFVVIFDRLRIALGALIMSRWLLVL